MLVTVNFTASPVNRYGIAREVDMDGANARDGGGMSNNCCGVRDQLKWDDVDIPESDSDGVIHAAPTF